nr:hypothetical protein CFP56_36516 [Quercus suber]
MIPASSNRAGWSLFQRELRNFFTGAKLGSMADVSSKNGGGGGGLSVGGDRSENLLSASGNQQKIRNFEKFGAILGQNGIPGVPIGNGSVLNDNVSVINGRSTQACTFKLTPAFLALRVCKSEGEKCTVTVLGAKDVKLAQGVKGELERNIGVSFRVTGASSGVGEFIGGFRVADDDGGAGECNRGGLILGFLVWRRQGSKKENPIVEVGSLSHLEGVEYLNPAVESRLHGDHDFVGSRSFLPLGNWWADSNRFSILANSGREGDPWSVEEVGDVFSESQTEVYDGGAPHTGKEFVDGSLSGGSELLLLPREQSGAFSSLFGSGVHESGPLECVSLSWWDPKVAKDLVLNRGEDEGAQSKWVSNMMCSFCKMVGFPIVRHEAQCVALFRLLEQEFLEVVNEGSG